MGWPDDSDELAAAARTARAESAATCSEVAATAEELELSLSDSEADLAAAESSEPAEAVVRSRARSRDCLNDAFLLAARRLAESWLASFGTTELVKLVGASSALVKTAARTAQAVTSKT